MVGNKVVALLIIIKTAIVVIAGIVYQAATDNMDTSNIIGDALYGFINLVIFNAMFFTPTFLLKNSKKLNFRRNLLRGMILLNTSLIWYFTIPQAQYLTILLIADALLFEFYLIRKLGY